MVVRKPLKLAASYTARSVVPPLATDRCVHPVLSSDVLHLASRNALARDTKIHGITKPVKRRLRHVVTALEPVAELSVRVRCKVETGFAGFVPVVQIFLLCIRAHTGHHSNTVSNARISKKRLKTGNKTRV